MVDLRLDQNEAVLLQTTNVRRYDRNDEIDVNELYLTNKHLIFVYEESNGLVAKPRMIIDKTPLTAIRVTNGVVQVKQVIDVNYGKELQIDYNSGNIQLLKFYSSPENKFPMWPDTISEAILQTAPKSREQQNTGTTNGEQNVNKLKFCTNCGTRLDVGAKFCKNCGKKISFVEKNSSENQCETFSYEPITERKIAYEGILHKCPNCGEILKSFAAFCPTCGHEIRDTNAVGSVRELSLKLERIDSEKMPEFEEKQSTLKSIVGTDLRFGMERRSAMEVWKEEKENRKANLIINFAVPNAKEDILEFMLLADANIDAKKGTEDVVSKAWYTKMTQIYEKAKISMVESSDIDLIGNILKKKRKKIRKHNATIHLILGISYTLFFSIPAMVFWNVVATTAIVVVIIVLIIVCYNSYINK